MKNFRISFQLQAEDSRSAMQAVRREHPSVKSFMVTEAAAPSIQPPGIKQMALNATTSLTQAMKNPARVSPEEQQRRMDICKSCEFLINKNGFDRCGKCGCFVKWKSALESWHCPIKKW